MLTDKTTTTIIDVQQTTSTSVSIISDEASPAKDTTTTVQASDKKLVTDTISNSTEITSIFTGVTVQSITSKSTAFTTTY